jgi:hypothetical protein
MVHLEDGISPAPLAQTIGPTDRCQTRFQTSPHGPTRHGRRQLVAIPDRWFWQVPNTPRLGRDNIQNQLFAAHVHGEGLHPPTLDRDWPQSFGSFASLDDICHACLVPIGQKAGELPPREVRQPTKRFLRRTGEAVVVAPTPKHQADASHRVGLRNLMTTTDLLDFLANSFALVSGD